MTYRERKMKQISERLAELNSIIKSTSDLQKGFDANVEAIDLTQELILLEKCTDA